jgi:hypothetical protein
MGELVNRANRLTGDPSTELSNRERDKRIP